MKFTCFIPVAGFAASSAVSDRIDRTSGVIKDVKIISSGAAKGHGVLIDGTTLAQVKECAERYATGLKVKFNPETFDHGTGSIAGLVPKESFKIVDGALIGNFKVAKEYQHRDYVFELAETQPDTFGLSIDFTGDPEDIGGVMFARCKSIDAVTIVDRPAANDSGLFSYKEDKPTTTNQTSYIMNDADKAEFKKMLADGLSEGMKPMSDRMGKIETQMSAIQKNGMSEEDDKEPSTSGMSAEGISAERMSAGVKEGDDNITIHRKVNRFRKEQAKPASVGDLGRIVREELTKLSAGTANNGVTHNLTKGGGGEKKLHAFAERVQFHSNGGAGKALAIQRAIQDVPAPVYEDYLSKLAKKEIDPA